MKHAYLTYMIYLYFLSLILFYYFTMSAVCEGVSYIDFILMILRSDMFWLWDNIENAKYLKTG